MTNAEKITAVYNTLKAFGREIDDLLPSWCVEFSERRKTFYLSVNSELRVYVNIESNRFGVELVTSHIYNQSELLLSGLAKEAAQDCVVTFLNRWHRNTAWTAFQDTTEEEKNLIGSLLSGQNVVYL